MKLKKNDIWKTVKNLFLVTAGTVILAFGTAVFILPFNMVMGGVSGISVVLSKALPWDISVELMITVLTWGLFFVGLFWLGKSFAVKTLLSTVVYPIGVALFGKLADPSVMDGFFYLPASQHAEIALVLSAAVGGVLVGVGCSLAFLGGGSTGGVDIIALILCRVFRRLKSSVAFFAIDATIITLGIFIIRDPVLSMLGILSVLISSTMVDKVFLGGKRTFVAYVITDRYEELSKLVIEGLDRSTTIMDAVGGYTGKARKIVMVSFTMRQYSELRSIVKSVDRDAFITIHEAHEINGEGFTR